jgi:hypothetical protein
VTDQDRLRRAVRNAEALSGFSFSLYVGVAEEDARSYAARLHRALDDPARSVLVMCDPEFHALEIVTGAATRRRLDDRACALAAASMQTSFAGGDIIGGLTVGVQQLGEAARAPRTLHASPRSDRSVLSPDLGPVVA